MAESTDDPNDGESDNTLEGGVALLFMASQSSIEGQFEVMQQALTNNYSFYLNSSQQSVGIDPVSGPTERASPWRYPLQHGVCPLSNQLYLWDWSVARTARPNFRGGQRSTIKLSARRPMALMQAPCLWIDTLPSVARRKLYDSSLE